MSKITTLILTTSIALSALSFSAPQAQQPPQAQPNVLDVQGKKDKLEKQIETAASSPGAAIDPNSFQLGAEDIIFVLVFDEPKFTGPHVIRPDGRITMPLVGDIVGGGMTPNQLSKNIAEKLGTVLKDPQVTVSVTQVNSKKYFIQGEVNHPGTFPLVVPTTVMEAMSNTGGFHEFAKRKKIVIIRKGQRLKFNYDEVVKGKKLEQNIYLESGDYIIVQ